MNILCFLQLNFSKRIMDNLYTTNLFCSIDEHKNRMNFILNFLIVEFKLKLSNTLSKKIIILICFVEIYQWFKLLENAFCKICYYQTKSKRNKRSSWERVSKIILFLELVIKIVRFPPLHIFWGSKNLKAYYNYLAIIQKVGDKITEQISIIEKYLSIHAQKGFLLVRTEKAYFLNLWWNIIFSLSSFWWFFFKHFIRFDLFRWNWRDSVFSNILQVPIHFAYGIIYHI